MKAAVLYEEENKDRTYQKSLSSLMGVLEERSVHMEKIGLKSGSIKNCMGCFGCWTKTPGECVIGDYGNEIAKKIINSHRCIILSPIRFGSYSYVIKQAVDRFIPLISPFFRFVDGEVHHRVRYDKYPHLLPIGILTPYNKTQEELFKKLIRRNRINFFTPQSMEIVISDRDKTESIKEKIISGIRHQEA